MPHTLHTAPTRKPIRQPPTVKRTKTTSHKSPHIIFTVSLLKSRDDNSELAKNCTLMRKNSTRHSHLAKRTVVGKVCKLWTKGGSVWCSRQADPRFSSSSIDFMQTPLTRGEQFRPHCLSALLVNCLLRPSRPEFLCLGQTAKTRDRTE